MSLFVTGFGPFMQHAENPSAVLAEASGLPFPVLEVSYRGVDEFVSSLDLSGFDSWLALGLAANATTVLCETVGRNWLGVVPDVRGETYGPGPIDPSGPPAIASSLWCGAFVESDLVRVSADAGGYLCNSLLYLALRKFPDKKIGFLHIPPFSVVPFERQLVLLQDVIASLKDAHQWAS